MSSLLNVGDAPPPYESDQAPPAHDAQSTTAPADAPPAYDHSEPRPPVSDSKRPIEEPQQPQPESAAGPSSSATTASSASSSLNPFSNLKTAYQEKQRAKLAAKKVDYYEKIYGFVPKNVMTEAEWKDARDRAPKVKKSTEWGARTYFGPR
ncbi:hypothetical protein F5X68DRAFT_213389 [Plectosphaerella plurivora]|uniref:Uncharacterized protein n=1 Tax=Plectosphaerella plurivora TaxID=936078 RepID=A0A9P8V604_9PEZI|nr:hypothetical protein F5X68DRAFT_213389 [Plectosphaerella plurivora]